MIGQGEEGGKARHECQSASPIFRPTSAEIHSTNNIHTKMTQKPILISGAGLASLLLARSLLRCKVPFRVFERDYHLEAKDTGFGSPQKVLTPSNLLWTQQHGTNFTTDAVKLVVEG
jgi:hypothetical protein